MFIQDRLFIGPIMVAPQRKPELTFSVGAEAGLSGQRLRWGRSGQGRRAGSTLANRNPLYGRGSAAVRSSVLSTKASLAGHHLPEATQVKAGRARQPAAPVHAPGDGP